MKIWPLQDAKAQFSKVVQRANEHGPQAVTRHGKLAAVILSAADYASLAAPRALKMPDLEARFSKAMGNRHASALLADSITADNRGE